MGVEILIQGKTKDKIWKYINMFRKWTKLGGQHKREGEKEDQKVGWGQKIEDQREIHLIKRTQSMGVT